MEPAKPPKTRFIAIIQTILAIGLGGLYFNSQRQSARLDWISASIEQMKLSLESKASPSPAAATAGVAKPEEETNFAPSPDPIEEPPIPLELKTLQELAAFLDPIFVENENLNEKAQALSDVNDWGFHPNDEMEAFNLIDGKVEILRRAILGKVKSIDYEALRQINGKEALRNFSEASALLGLCPIPRNDAEQKEFSEFVGNRESIRRKILEISRLRYNQWAIEQLEKGFKGYHEKKSTISPRDEDPKLVESAAGALELVNPDYLDVSVTELYLKLLKTTNEAIDEEHQILLAKRLNNPAVPKRAPEDF